jgi:hypothetical protein
MRGRGIRPGVALAALGLGLAGGGVDAQTVTYSGGLFYAGGSYVFDQRSDAFYLSNGLRIGLGSFELGASIPIVVQNGGVVTRVAGGVPLPTGGVDHRVVGRRPRGDGIGTGGHGMGPGSTTPDDSLIVAFDDAFSAHVGDPSLSASFEPHSGFGALRSVRINGAAKVPLNDVDSGVGSGAWDVGLGSSATIAARGVLLFADLSYWWLGDLPDLELSDGLAYGVGASRSAFGGEGTVLLMLSGMARTIETMEAPLSAALSVSHTVGSRGFLSGGLGVGLTESAPDLTVQLGWSVRR